MCKILDSLHINYETQKTFEDCKDKIKLRFDFYFLFNNKEYCVEVDGEQHFKPIEFWGGESAFREIRKRDRIKNNYCLLNGINLIRIPFNEIDNAKYIIKDYLKSTASSEVSA